MAIPTHYIELSDYLADHLATETGALDAYERALEGRPEDAASYLIRLILADERRHHQLFAEIRNSLESTIAWQNIEPRLPSSRVSEEGRSELLAATERLLELETEDARSLRQLRRTWARRGGDQRFWSLLVETAEFDTKKHIAILCFLRELLDDAT